MLFFRSPQPKKIEPQKVERRNRESSFRYLRIMKAHKPQRMVTDIRFISNFLNINYSSFSLLRLLFYLGLETLNWKEFRILLCFEFYFHKNILWFVAHGKSETRKEQKHECGGKYLFLLKSESRNISVQHLRIGHCWGRSCGISKKSSRKAVQVQLFLVCWNAPRQRNRHRC